ncbi:UvrD-helicase domain-containing protein [Janthinobacterium sp. LB2P10]|uniref:UvrD-helicase domain-containing protein n=1 Tax=Janthinobacterium sp. LB2P10 TaxID=3424194 RepID=UPI003F211C77
MVNFVPSVQQDQAIQCLSNMVIVASPGSGKTSVLSRKIRNLIPGLHPHQGIIAISFTNKASDELERRCKESAFDVKNSFFGTIDEFCLREIVFPFARQLMLVATQVKTAKLSELPVQLTSSLPIKPIQQATVADIADFLPFLQGALAQGYVPLEAVGMLASHVFIESLACRKYLVARYRAVFIDEYQDSGYFQHELFLNLRTLGLSAVAVGDGDQSIYAFAHKDTRYLLQLTVPGSGFAQFAITTNFRSHPSVNDYAQRLLNPNHAVNPTNDFRVFLKTSSGDQRAIGTWLTTAIPHLMNHFGVDLASRVAIFCRHQHSARLIADHLKVNYYLVEDSPFETTPSTESSHFTDLLRLRYDSQLTVEPLIERVGRLKLSRVERRELRRVLLRCRTCAATDLVASVLDATSLITGQTVSSIGEAELKSVCDDASKLRWFHCPSRDAVQIMTLHKAKGLEFDLVFHADLYDHVIPTRLYPPGTFGHVIFENETQCLNLHYVGITRAIKACVLMTSTVRINRQGQSKTGAPSQFIGRNGISAIPITW